MYNVTCEARHIQYCYEPQFLFASRSPYLALVTTYLTQDVDDCITDVT